MFNVGTGELAVILLLALIVLGPDKLPEAARTAGKYLAEFRRISGGFQQEFRDAMDSAMASTPERPADEDRGTGAFSLPVIDGREAEVAPPEDAPSAPSAVSDVNGSTAAEAVMNEPAPEAPNAAGDGRGSGPAPDHDPPRRPRVMVDGPSSSFR